MRRKPEGLQTQFTKVRGTPDWRHVCDAVQGLGKDVQDAVEAFERSQVDGKLRAFPGPL
jgi:hypothetical protein